MWKLPAPASFFLATLTGSPRQGNQQPVRLMMHTIDNAHTHTHTHTDTDTYQHKWATLGQRKCFFFLALKFEFLCNILVLFQLPALAVVPPQLPPLFSCLPSSVQPSQFLSCLPTCLSSSAQLMAFHFCCCCYYFAYCRPHAPPLATPHAHSSQYALHTLSADRNNNCNCSKRWVKVVVVYESGNLSPINQSCQMRTHNVNKTACNKGRRSSRRRQHG